MQPRHFPIVVFVTVFLCFLGTIYHDFVNLDDLGNLTNNPHYRGLSLRHLRWMFTAFHLGHYQPLTWVSFAGDYLLWGMNPHGYHFTNVLLHASNAVIFYFIIQQLLAIILEIRSRHTQAFYWAAVIGSLFFAIHPLRTESVAWVTERRDVLCGFFYLLTLQSYLIMHIRQASSRPWGKWYGLSLLFFLLSLLSKAWGITLPLVLMLIDIYPLRRLRLARLQLAPLVEKIPYWLLALAIAAMAFLAQKNFKVVLSLEAHGIGQRCLQAGYGICFYLYKTLAPFRLCAFYELRRIDPLDWHYLLPLVIALTLTAILWLQRRQWPGLATLWFCYLVILSPVLGLVQCGPQLVADRYSYLACLPFSLIVSFVLYRVFSWQEVSSGIHRLRIIVPVVVLAALATLTCWQCRTWKNSISLWQQVRTVDDKCARACYNLGCFFREQQPRVAIEYFKLTLAIDPSHDRARHNLANSLVRINRYDYAIRQWDLITAIPMHGAERKKFYAAVWTGKGAAFAKLGLPQQARECYERACQINPDFSPAWYNQGKLFLDCGNYAKAVVCLQRVLQLTPGDSQAWMNQGIALFYLKNYRQAQTALLRAADLGEVKAKVVWKTLQAQLQNQKTPSK